MPRFTIRFSLRTLLLLATLVCAIVAVAVRCHDARERNRKAAIILSGAGIFKNPYAAQPWHVGWRSRLSYALHGFDETKLLITYISAPIYNRDDFTDAHSPYLLECDNLEAVSLFECSITDRSMAVMSNMTSLKGIQIVDAPATSDGVVRLRYHPHLEWLELNKTLIGDDACQHFATIANLRQLECCDTQITDSGLFQLGNCHSLEKLHVDRTNVTDEGVSWLASLPRLRALSLIGTRVTGRAFAGPGFASLKELYLDESPVDDEGMCYISRLPSLGELWVNKSRVTDRGVHYLRMSPSPVYLYARSANVSADVVSSINAFHGARAGR